MISRAAAISFFLSAACAFPQARFEIASVKPSRLSGEGRYRETISANPGTLIMHNVSLKSAFQWAYRMKEYQVSGPAWLGDERYDISAKAAVTTDEEQIHAMLQNLLTDRFKIALHHEKKDLPTYMLLVAKNGPKLASGNPDGKSVLQPKRIGLAARDTSLSEVADFLTQMATRMNLPPVVDMTGLAGRYNFTVDATGFMQSVVGDRQGNVAPEPLAIVTGVQEILQDQLGLRTELRKAPTDVLIVDQAEKLPTEN
jgi:uncharacterized protein (TIGR03435 family)